MARAKANKPYVNFVQGLITEASPLTFPENATIAEDNFILNRNGSRRRRFGIDYEAEYALTDTNLTPAAYSLEGVSLHAWENVNDDAAVAIAVVQVANELYFYNLLADNISSAPLNQGNSLTIEGAHTSKIQTTAVGGDLVVASGVQEIHVLHYDAATDTVTKESHGLLVRDIWGVEDDLDVDERPAALSPEHEYNLLNQGWGAEDPDSAVSLYASFKSSSGTGKFPSNADLASFGQDPNDDSKFKPELIARSMLGATPAPKGHFVIDLFLRGGSRSKVAGSRKTLRTNFGISRWGEGVSGAYSLLDTSLVTSLPNIPTDTTDTGISVVATYAGRAFYSGMASEVAGGDARSPLLGSYILFSQIVDNSEKLAQCYQEADPTSSNISDLVDTDGGIIKIPEMSRCRRLVNMGRSLIAFADNGIWEISGGETNFTATSLEVTKISSTGAIGPDAVVNAEGNVFYWAEGGIYNLQVDDVTRQIAAVNITENTIQTLYDEIPELARVAAVGSYDPAAKKVQWLYNDSPLYDGVTNRFKYNRALALDVVLGAFYPWTIDTSGPFVASALIVPNRNSADVTFNIVDGADNVVSGGNNVASTVTSPVSGASRTKYLVSVPSATQEFTIGFERDATFVDWATYDGTGVDAAAFMVTGYELMGDIQRKKQIDSLTTHFIRSETGFELADGELEAVNPSSCTMQVQWDFADSSASGKFGESFEAYRLPRNYIPEDESDPFDYGYKVISTKHKPRGEGKAISLRMDTAPGHDMQLLGWAIGTSGGTDV